MMGIMVSCSMAFAIMAVTLECHLIGDRLGPRTESEKSIITKPEWTAVLDRFNWEVLS